MQCFIVGADREESRRRLLTSVAQPIAGTVVCVTSLASLEADRRFSQANRPLVLVADTAEEPIPADAAIRFALEQRGHAFTVYVSDTIAPDDYKHLVRSGSADWIEWRNGAQELRDLTARFHGGDAVARTARVLSFLPSKGGVGNTTLLVEVAACLAARLKRGGGRVAIVDLNLQGGTVADALDIEPRFDVSEIIGRPERLDEQLIDVFTSRHSDRLDVFAGPERRIGPDELEPQILFTFIDSISSRYEIILFDLPQHWLAWIDSLLLGSDAVVLTGAGNVPALRKLKGRLDYLTNLGIPANRVATVINGVEADLLGRVVRRAEIERVLAGQRCFFVRRDGHAVDEAANAGRPLMEAPSAGRIGRDLRVIADWLETEAGRSAPPETPPLRAGTAA